MVRSFAYASLSVFFLSMGCHGSGERGDAGADAAGVMADAVAGDSPGSDLSDMAATPDAPMDAASDTTPDALVVPSDLRNATPDLLDASPDQGRPDLALDVAADRGAPDAADGGALVASDDADPCPGHGALVWATPLTSPGFNQDVKTSGVAVLPDSSIIVVGSIYNGGGGAPVPFGTGADRTLLTASDTGSAFWARYDADGKWIAAGSMPGSSSAASHVAGLPDGSFLVAGYLEDSMIIDFGLPTQRTLSASGRSDDDIFLAHLGTDGHVIWIVQGVGAGSSRVTGLAVLKDGRVALTGSGKPTFDTMAVTGPAFLALFSPDGKPQWTRALSYSSGAGGAALSALRALDDDSLAMTGYFFSSATFEGSPGAALTGSQDRETLFVARYLADGGLSFARRAGALAMGENVISGAPGEILVTGYADAKADFGIDGPTSALLPSFGSFVARYGNDGSFRDVTLVRHGSSIDDEAGLVRTDRGALVWAGTFQYTRTFGAVDAIETYAQGWQDAYVTCMSPSGKMGWVRTIGGILNDFGRAIVALPGGDVVVTGTNRAAGTASTGAAEVVSLPLATGVAGNSFLARYRP